MQNHSLPRVVGWIAMVVALLLPAAARAQSGRIAGTVTDKAGQPVPGASVVVLGTGYGTLSKADGAFLIDPVPAGTYRVSVSHLGFRTQTAEDVTVAAGQAAQLAVSLEESPVEIAGVVVSASRRPERITDAPATITSIDTRTLDNSVGNTWAGALKEVKGLDFIQVGMTSIAINARGFNSSFNNRMLMMEDGRIAVLPENGLPVGQFTAVPKVDLAGVEVLVGPGAALYGADASNGVVTLLTKDPKQFPGTTAEVTGGNRSYKDVQVRQAGVFANGDWGYKVSGEYQEAKDFSNILTYNITGVAGAPGGIKAVKETDLGINSIDWDAKAARATASLVRYFGSNGKIDLSGGLSQSDGVGQTNVGRNQLRDWGYNFVQLRASNPNWFFNAYRTQSTSGESFAINRYADAFARNQSLSPDSLRMLSDWPSDGQLYAAELQNNFGIRQLLNTRITWGAQYRHDKVSSKRQWLTDRLTGEDLSIDQKGIYAQTETPFSKYASLVLAGRYDDHENYDAQFSPKAALLLHPAPNQTLRVSYNRAFKSPTTLQTNFYIPDWTAVIAIYGNTEGFTIKNSAGATVATYKPLEPEENRTWEAGYKGILGDKVFLDLAGYYSKYNNFLSPLAIIANPFTGATAT
ncbi:MAG TPA: TonB-dependent receptor, partial [Longimicrobiales bacterium]|nr:TonB-dependent receptor [Longimicrobiales bacterium]